MIKRHVTTIYMKLAIYRPQTDLKIIRKSSSIFIYFQVSLCLRPTLIINYTIVTDLGYRPLTVTHPTNSPCPLRIIEFIYWKDKDNNVTSIK